MFLVDEHHFMSVMPLCYTHCLQYMVPLDPQAVWHSTACTSLTTWLVFARFLPTIRFSSLLPFDALTLSVRCALVWVRSAERTYFVHSCNCFLYLSFALVWTLLGIIELHVCLFAAKVTFREQRKEVILTHSIRKEIIHFEFFTDGELSGDKSYSCRNRRRKTLALLFPLIGNQI